MESTYTHAVMHGNVVKNHIFMESLILAQDERWRRA